MSGSRSICPGCGVEAATYNDEKHCCTCPPDAGDMRKATPNLGEVVWELRDDAVWAVGGAVNHFETEQTCKSLLVLIATARKGLIGRRWEWEECDFGCEDGRVGPIPKSLTLDRRINCPKCFNHATYGLKPGQVRVECGRCAGADCHRYGPDGPPWPNEGPSRFCFEGYRVEEIEG